MRNLLLSNCCCVLGGEELAVVKLLLCAARWWGTCWGRLTSTTIGSSPAWNSAISSPSRRILPTASAFGCSFPHARKFSRFYRKSQTAKTARKLPTCCLSVKHNQQKRCQYVGRRIDRDTYAHIHFVEFFGSTPPPPHPPRQLRQNKEQKTERQGRLTLYTAMLAGGGGLEPILTRGPWG